MSDRVAPASFAVLTDGLTRYFGPQCAVDGVELRVEAGTFYGFLGPNGAGKSTTIKMLTGLLQPTSGMIRILGYDPAVPNEAIEIKRRIGVVPENLALYENLTAIEYLAFVGKIYLLDRQVMRQRIDELLELMQLANEQRKLARDFSHGMRKKLALSAALLPNPDLLFLDEPFEGVDALASSMIREVLNRFRARGGTVFLTSHILDIVERLCTHVGIIFGGKLVEQTSLAELRQGDSLEKRFLEKLGYQAEAGPRLSWLEGGLPE
ncbi:MAG: ABC transporter ATP-binding protein [Planctomycetota bacterium]|jgi:ABC-2 type transport system ATP-binding protein